jgi:hypothetical protein
MIVNEDSRTGSELLRDVERKLDTLKRHVQNMDNNLKIVLSQFNTLMQALSQPEPVATTSQDIKLHSSEVNLHSGSTSPPKAKLGDGTEPDKTYKFEDLPKTNKFEEMQGHYGLVEEPERERIKAKPQGEDAFDKYELVEESKKKGRARGQRVPEKSSNRVGVSQQILFPNGSPAFLASVEILNAGGVQIKQTRTNTKGHWVAPLEPGEYTVHVVKHVPPESDKKSFDIRYVVEIPPSDKPLELPPPEIGE